MNKVAIISGASKGIGKAISKKLIDNNIDVALISKQDEKGLKEVTNYAKQKNIRAKYYLADVSDYNKMKEIYINIMKEFGNIDILVNNAGISLYKLFNDCNEADFDKIVGTNIKGVFNLSRLVSDDMIRVKSGNIINISSIWGQSGSSMEVLYSMTKGAVNSFSKALAKELAPSGIRVNAIAPGVVDTTMNNIFNEEDKKTLMEEIPMGRFAKAEEIADLVLFLISENSSYISGQVITIDGAFL